MSTVPVLFLVFNRPEPTRRVFEEIRKAKPAKLFIAADGPRPNRIDDVQNCAEVLEVVSHVDWPCDVQTLFRDENLGCKDAVASAIDWFFSKINAGIIIEDDCLPHQSFFPFCAELLERHSSDERIMMVSGLNIASAWPSDSSYFYSKYCASWGWATWKRAWKLFDKDIASWKDKRTQDIIRRNIGNTEQWRMKQWIYDRVYAGKRTTWDYSWEAAMLSHGGLCIVPRCNLVQNIGFDASATHTKNEKTTLSIARKEIVFPLAHNPNIAVDNEYDAHFIEKVFGTSGRTRKLFRRVSRKIQPHIDNIRAWRIQSELRKLRNTPRFTATTADLMGTRLQVPDSGSFLSAYEEIVKREIYSFASGTPAPYILDCGANVGVSVLYLKRLFPQAEIIAFEPDRKIFETLKKNVEATDSSGITLINKAVWDKETELPFFAQGADGGRLADAAQADYSDGDAQKAISTVSLKGFMGRPVDFLKIDVEGAEGVIMRNIAPLLSNVRSLFVEYHSRANARQDLDDILAILRNAGFRYYIESVGVRSAKPLVTVRSNGLGFDNQLNIFAYRS